MITLENGGATAKYQFEALMNGRSDVVKSADLAEEELPVFEQNVGEHLSGVAFVGRAEEETPMRRWEPFAGHIHDALEVVLNINFNSWSHNCGISQTGFDSPLC